MKTISSTEFHGCSYSSVENSGNSRWKKETPEVCRYTVDSLPVDPSPDGIVGMRIRIPTEVLTKVSGVKNDNWQKDGKVKEQRSGPGELMSSLRN